MIANFFSKTKPIHAIFISGIFFVFYLASIFFVEQAEFSFFLLLEKIGVVLVFLVLFFLIRFINRKNQLSGQDSYFLLISALLFGMFPNTMLLNPIFISHFLLLLVFRRTYSIRSLKNINQKVFDSGFWIGVASLFYIWSSLFLILVFVAILTYKNDKVRSLLILIIGFFTSLFLVFTYYFWIDAPAVFFEKLIFEYSFSLQWLENLQFKIPIIFLLISSMVSMLITRIKVNQLSNEIKPSWKLLVTHYFIAIYMIIVAPNKAGIVFVFFPAAIFIANTLQLISHKVIREVVVFSFLTIAILVYFL